MRRIHPEQRSAQLAGRFSLQCTSTILDRAENALPCPRRAAKRGDRIRYRAVFPIRHTERHHGLALNTLKERTDQDTIPNTAARIGTLGMNFFGIGSFQRTAEPFRPQGPGPHLKISSTQRRDQKPRRYWISRHGGNQGDLFYQTSLINLAVELRQLLQARKARTILVFPDEAVHEEFTSLHRLCPAASHIASAPRIRVGHTVFVKLAFHH